jgi:hypothetical protein
VIFYIATFTESGNAAIARNVFRFTISVAQAAVTSYVLIIIITAQTFGGEHTPAPHLTFVPSDG